MRDILFRGKRTDNGEWVYGDYGRYAGTHGIETVISEINLVDFSESNVYEVDRETICQYTGLNDKNGNKIFEGDIFKSKQDGMIGVIRFGEYQTTNSGNGECHLGFSIEWYGKYSDMLRRDLGWWVKVANKDINIVGNIHDNTGLLEV